MTSQENRGKAICSDLQLQGFNAEYQLDFDGELLILIEKQIFRCIGQVDIDGVPMGSWVQVYPTFQSITNRSLGQRKLKYLPVNSLENI